MKTTPFSETEILSRRRAFQKKLKQQSDPAPDYSLIMNANNIRYLTGYSGSDAALLLSSRSAWLITDSRYTETAEKSCAGVRVVLRQGGFVETAQTIIPSNREPGVFGFEPEEWSFGFHRRASKALKGWRLRMLPRIVESLREIKSDAETDLIRSAVRAQKKAYELWRKELKIGMSELDSAALLRYLMVSRFGAQDESFRTIVAFDENSSMPHYEPGAKRLGKNSLVLVDWGATVGQYHSDMTRSFFVGKPNRELERIYGIVSNAQALAIAAIRPGVVASAVDAVARDHIRDCGYGDRFGHCLGHGIGLAVHEGPVLSAKSETILEPGHIVTVEPGIYVPGLGGIRIEDDIIVTPAGGRVIDG